MNLSTVEGLVRGFRVLAIVTKNYVKPGNYN